MPRSLTPDSFKAKKAHCNYCGRSMIIPSEIFIDELRESSVNGPRRPVHPHVPHRHGDVPPIPIICPNCEGEFHMTGMPYAKDWQVVLYKKRHVIRDVAAVVLLTASCLLLLM